MFLDEIKHIYTNVTKQELEKLHELAKDKNICVEIGSYLGASSIAIASALAEKNKLYCIDIFLSNKSMRPDPQQLNRQNEKNKWINDKTSIFEVFLKNTEKYKNKITPIVDYSYNAINYFIENKIKVDLLFFDGDHTYEGIKTDYDLYFPLLNKGGVIVFHDYGWGTVKNFIHNEAMKYLEKTDFLPNMFWGYKK